MTARFLVNRTYETWKASGTDDRGFTYQDETYTLRDLVNEMRREGITEPSSSYISGGEWFSSIDPDRDYSTGEETYHSIHLRKLDGSRLDARTTRRIIHLINHNVRLSN